MASKQNKGSNEPSIGTIRQQSWRKAMATIAKRKSCGGLSEAEFNAKYFPGGKVPTLGGTENNATSTEGTNDEP